MVHIQAYHSLYALTGLFAPAYELAGGGGAAVVVDTDVGKVRHKGYCTPRYAVADAAAQLARLQEQRAFRVSVPADFLRLAVKGLALKAPVEVLSQVAGDIDGHYVE